MPSPTQDYPASGRINVVEFEDRLVVANMGSFLPGDVEDVIRRDAPFSVYREPLPRPGDGRPANDRHHRQRHQADLSGAEEAFLSHAGLRPEPRQEVQVQHHRQGDRREIHPDADGEDGPGSLGRDRSGQGAEGKADDRGRVQVLKAKKLVEGRRPNLFVSAEVAAATETKAEYIKKRAFDKDHYKKMVVAYLKKFGEAKREDIDKLLLDKLSDALDEEQKGNFITKSCFRRCGGKGPSDRGIEAVGNMAINIGVAGKRKIRSSFMLSGPKFKNASPISITICVYIITARNRRLSPRFYAEKSPDPGASSGCRDQEIPGLLMKLKTCGIL